MAGSGAPEAQPPYAPREDATENTIIAQADRPGRRIPWSTSHLSGSPDPPPPYTIEPAFPKLTFELPVVMVSAPGTERLFVGELKGKIYSFPNDPKCDKADLAIDLAQLHPDMTMYYGLTFHPHFAQNRFVYLSYVVTDGLPDGSRVSRFEVSQTDPPRIDPRSEKIIITWLAGGHNGACLAFGNDGYLYVSTGDGAGPAPPDPLDTGQDVSDLLSSILRIDVDHEEDGRAYRVPPDNPFVNTPGARPEIWAYGFRNPWKMSFDKASGDLWVGDVGWELWEMIYRVERGGNYGWSVIEGSQQPVHPEGRRGPTPIIPPTVEHPHSEAASITGGYVYRGNRLRELVGAYIYGDFQTGKVWGLRHDGQRVVWHRELADTPLELVAFGEDNAGELYAIDHERSKQIYRFVPNRAAELGNRDFPRALSQTGLFASTKELKPAPGVVPYAINAELWSDHARAERLLAVPGTSRIGFDIKGNWKLPEGSVLARTVSLELERGNSHSLRRLETQILHLEGDSWRPYTYVWNEGQTDATLVEAQGSSLALTIRDAQAPGGQRIQTYRVHARAECLLCHNPWVEKRTTMFGRQSASPLAINTEQLNRDQVLGAQVANQLQIFEQAGLFDQPLPVAQEDLPRLANPYDDSADVNRRARAYLHVNCSHCHQFNAGGTANILLAQSLALEATKTVGVRPNLGSFGISDARIIAPGDPDGSVLLYRMSKLGGGRMPRVGSNVVDERAVALIYRWIEGMSRPDGAPSPTDPRAHLGADNLAALATLRTGERSAPELRTSAMRRLTGSTRGALALLHLVDEGALSDSLRSEVVAFTKGHAQAEVRELFERFVPESERIKRLGEVINPADILALKSDATRGRQIFFADSATQCKNCHRINGTGETLGPDLSKIGTKYAKPALLEHILEPSRVIEPKYTTYLLETKSGQISTGLIDKKTDDEVILRDAQNQTIRVAASDVERLVPQPKSIMPDLLLRDMTAQQVADLLEFLASQK